MKNSNGEINIKVIIIIIAANIILSVLLWIFIPKFLGTDKNPAEEKEKNAQTENEEAKKDSTENVKDYFEDYAIYNWEDIIVNPSDADNRYLVVSLGFEYKLEDEKLPTELENKKVLITDNINSYLSSQSLIDLANNKNREKMKENIKKIVNKLLSEGKITNVLFAQYVIQ